MDWGRSGQGTLPFSDLDGPGAATRAGIAADLACAGKTVVISAPYANPKLVESLLLDFAGAIARGIEVKVILRKPRSEKSLALQSGLAATLSNAGCKVAVCDAPLTGIAVFDSRIAWYGTLPLLAFAKADDCCLRVESAEVAADLKKALEDPV